MSATAVAAPKYVEAIGRNPGEERQCSHLYLEITEPDPEDSRLVITTYIPMCRKGWNRSDGERFSIFRGHRGEAGLCRVCSKRAALNLPGVEGRAGSHKTKWL